MRTRLHSLRLCTLAVACGAASALAQQVRLTNPYESVDWSTYSHYRADLHVHTIQSDGCHHLYQVVRVFREAGFSILSITDHDAVSPNQCVLGEPSPYPDPRPANFPADTTWPWNAYGAPAPAELGMLGIEGAELTCTYHINSFFNDYGFAPCSSDDRPTPDDWLVEVARRDGLAVLNHPGGSAKADGLEWVTALYGNPANDRLVGMELAGGATTDVNAALWDQLLGMFMPDRPIWGFGTSDMHLLSQTRFAFTVFLLDELTEAGVKDAMRTGRFYAVTGPKVMDFSRNRSPDVAPRAEYDGMYPELRSIVVDREAAKISIDAAGYDEIVWTAKPSATEPSPAPAAAAPWPAARVVQRGPVLDYADIASPYVRAELIRQTAEGPVRVFLNPFALTTR